MTEHLAFVRTRIVEVLTYRFELLFQLINPLLQLLLLAAVWRAVYAGKSDVDGVSVSTMTTYVTLSTLHTLLMHDQIVHWVEQRVRSGAIGIDLVRPIPLLRQQVLSQVSQVAVKVPMMAVVFPVAVLTTGLVAPAAPALYALSTLLGWLVNCCVLLLIAAVAFWTLELGGMTFLYYVVSQFLSGALVPLWFMPDWLRTAVEWLPLQATVFTPVAIYLGKDGWRGIGVQAVWLVLLGTAVVLVWRRAVHRVVVQGG